MKKQIVNVLIYLCLYLYITYRFLMCNSTIFFFSFTGIFLSIYCYLGNNSDSNVDVTLI